MKKKSLSIHSSITTARIKQTTSRPGFPKGGRIAPKGAILVSWGAKIRKGAKRGQFKSFRQL